MQVGFLQFHPKFGNITANLSQIESLLGKCSADLLVLPELFATGYAFCSISEVHSLSETITGDTAITLQNIARQIEGIIVGGFIERDLTTSQIYNSALVVDRSGVLGTYRKIHLFFKEKQWFSPGNRKAGVYSITTQKNREQFSLGVMICFDWIFPEQMRSLSLLGADIVAHPANLVLPYCQNAMVTRCLENRVFAVTSNRIGVENRGVDHFSFTGQSQITDPGGSILYRASTDGIEVILREIDITQARNKYLNPFNNIIQDRHPEFYF